jgi:DNA-binding CsgD family transcriptional regulator
MERLTKKEVRALLECIKECYPICDLETFAQRVVSRLSKIVPIEISGNTVRVERKAGATALAYAYSGSENKMFGLRVHERSIFIDGKTHDIGRGRFHRLRYNKPRASWGVKYHIAQHLLKHAVFNHRHTCVANRKQFFLNMLRPHLHQAYRNAQTFTRMQQKLTLVDQALYGLKVGLIFLTPRGKVHLATTGAMQQLINYLGPQSVRENRLPDPLCRWLKQQEIALKRKPDILLQRNPLVLEREGGRLLIHLVSDLTQSLLLLEEHSTTIQLHSPVPRGLSSREAQVLGWVSQGKTNKEIGMILRLSPRTAQKHLEHIYEKIGVESRTAAVAKAYEMASLASNQTTFRKSFLTGKNQVHASTLRLRS